MRVNDDVLIVPTFDKGRRSAFGPKEGERGGGSGRKRERGVRDKDRQIDI